MDENKLRKIALDLIDDCQRDTARIAKREEFIYSMAYNDGVLDLLKRMLKEQAESEQVGNPDRLKEGE